MHPSLIRRDLGTLIPPKIATPSSLVCLLNFWAFPCQILLLTAFPCHIYLVYRLNADSKPRLYSTIRFGNKV